jgi:hypothetical protein
VKHKLATTLLVVAALVVSTFAALSGAKPAAAAPNNPPGTRWPINGGCPEKPGTPPPCAADNVILRWDEKLLQAIRLHPAQTGPTITSRAIGILHTATYDAWAAYDPTAVPTMKNGNGRRPASERTVTNKNKAISYAAYRVLLDLFPATRYTKIGQVDYPGQMTALTYDPNDTSTDPTTPQGIGNRAANAVLAFRHNDGSNQLNGYADPCVSPNCYQPTRKWNEVSDPGHWQPLCVLTPTGVSNNMPPTPPDGNCDPALQSNYTIQKPLAPHWKNVTRFAPPGPDEYVPPGPPKLADGSYDPKDIQTALADTSNLTDTKKMMAEYWADGPNTEFPPGHWAVIAQALSRKRGNSLDTDAKMFFVLGNAVLDAGVSAWSIKYAFDFWRPTTAIRSYYAGKMINSWLGPYKGYGLVPAEQWRPYQAPTVVTPNFPEYTSGHSTFSGAARVAIIAFTGTDSFSAQVTIQAGTSAFEPRDPNHVGTPATDVVLRWKNLLDASDQAGMSRRYGGIHFYSGDMHGRVNGGSLGYWVYDKATTYFNGTATPITPPTTP